MTIPDHPEPQAVAPAQDADEKTYCAVHPDVETGLRCNRCQRYMCVRCAVPTPVGYRCRECVNQQQDAFFKATQRDYLLAAGVAFALSLPVSFIIPRIFLLGVLLLSLPAGALIGEAVWRVVGRRRGRYLRQVAVAGIILGALVVTFPLLQAFFANLDAANQVSRQVRGDGNLTLNLVFSQLLPTVLYMVMCSLGATSRLR